VHVHEREDQTLVVLAGAITAWLDPLGASTSHALRIGDAVFLPRGVAHAFRVDAEGTRLLEINTPGGFGGFHIDAGEPATEERLPDPALLLAVSVVNLGLDPVVAVIDLFGLLGFVLWLVFIAGTSIWLLGSSRDDAPASRSASSQLQEA
jgi:hypothetical protein